MIITSILRRDLRLSVWRGAEAMTALAFFIICISLFAIASGGDFNVMTAFAPVMISLAALLSGLLGLDALYHRDYDDGTFDLMLLSAWPAERIFISKITVHILMIGLPLALTAFIGGVMLGLPVTLAGVIVGSILLQAIYTSLLGGLGAVLTMGSRRPALLLLVIVMPLLLPSLILAVSAISAGLAGMAVAPYVLLHLALVVAAMPVCLGAGSVLLKSLQS